jgi:hypothetical protein
MPRAPTPPRGSPERERALKIHAAACARGDTGYIDPHSGLMVLTAHWLRNRGFCCAAGCRHCPYSPEEQAAAGRPPDAEVW